MPMTPKYLRIIGLAALCLLAVRVRSAAVALVSPQKKTDLNQQQQLKVFEKKIIPNLGPAAVAVRN